MERTVYDLLNDAVFFEDFFKAANDIYTFSEAALREKNRATLVNHFYQRLYENTFGLTFTLDKEPWQIFEGREALSVFFSLHLPQKSTPVRTLKALQQFSKDILSTYTQPRYPRVHADRVREILSFLDREYDFSRRVFNSEKPSRFCLLNVSHTKYNSLHEYLTSRNASSHCFLLFHPTETASATPEDILLHELGHALHMAFLEKTEGVFDDYFISEEIKRIISTLGLPSLEYYTHADQVEIIAELFRIGMLYGTSYPTADPRDYTDPNFERKAHGFLRMILSALDSAGKSGGSVR